MLDIGFTIGVVPNANRKADAMTTPATLTQHSITVAVLRGAASVIDREGYTRYPDYEGEIGVDLAGAITLAANELDTSMEEAVSAFCGWLLMTGELRGTYGDITGSLIVRWETDARRSGDDVIDALLAAAAALQTTAYKYDDNDAAVVRNALRLLDCKDDIQVAAWLRNTYGDSAAPAGFVTAAAYGRARGLMGHLVRIIGQLTQ